MKSPFKLLDPYTEADRDAFFGREEEVDQLRNLFFSSKLILVYGPSGSGKTSLIQAGLGASLEPYDWFPVFIRRQGDYLSSIQAALNQFAHSPESENMPVPAALDKLYRQHLIPVTLIFDQLEELFILGTDEEKQQFYQLLSKLDSENTGCKIILIIREDYIGLLYELERVLPRLFGRKLRVEPMNYSKIEQVITGLFNLFNIRLDDSTKNIRQIFDRIIGERFEVSLPYLQICLDVLWQEVFERNYPPGWQREDYPV
jgi:AAA+ ATPase superfamily predicted ATPase